MKYTELRERVRTLVTSPATVPYIVDLVNAGQKSAAELTLVRHADGTFTATRGDLRTIAEPVRDATGAVLRFDDEDTACAWAWEESARAHAPRRPMSTDAEARAASSAERITRRLAALNTESA